MRYESWKYVITLPSEPLGSDDTRVVETAVRLARPVYDKLNGEIENVLRERKVWHPRASQQEIDRMTMVDVDRGARDLRGLASRLEEEIRSGSHIYAVHKLVDGFCGEVKHLNLDKPHYFDIEGDYTGLVNVLSDFVDGMEWLKEGNDNLRKAVGDGDLRT